MDLNGERVCDICGERYANKYQYGVHRRCCSLGNGNTEQHSDFSCSESSSSESSASEGSGAANSVIYSPVRAIDTKSLTRRAPAKWGVHETVTDSTCSNIVYDISLTKDYTELQEAWREYVCGANACYSPQFWRLFNTVKEQSKVVADAVISEVKQILLENGSAANASSNASSWPQSSRSLRKRVQRSCGNFWDTVMETHTISLSQFELGEFQSVDFTFVDPIWVWIQCCSSLHDSGTFSTHV